VDLNVFIKDVGELSVDSGHSAAELAKRYGKGPKVVVAMKKNGELVDLSTPLDAGDEIEWVHADTDTGRSILRHSTAHVLAQAVTRLWPGAHYAIGPAIDEGFYYDFELPGSAHFEEKDLEEIEAEMRKVIAEGQSFERKAYSFEDGLEIFSDQPFKVEIIKGVASQSEDSSTASEEGVSQAGITVYANSSGFVDLCRGPHVPSTSYLGHFKLTRISGAYWRGDEKRPQLQRIYGTAWESKAALEGYLKMIEEAAKRDHRKLGLELDLFHFPPEIGSGLPVFHPKGALLRYLMEEFSRKAHLRAGYEFAWTPHLAKENLFNISGHLQWYKDGMFPPMELEGSTYYMKPMNCPMHILIYQSRARSYRELPLRLFEFGTVYRYERSGTLHGLARVRGLTQDDSHIFCAKDQLATEVERLIRFVLALLGAFGLTNFEAEVATRPEKYIGSDEDWEVATASLIEALDNIGVAYKIAPGEGAFYAPKIDVHLTDAIGRRWQVSTLQVDLQEPQRFDLGYTSQDNTSETPYMLHRALFGSVERFMAILIEHYAGALPAWLSPTQVVVLPVSEGSTSYAKAVSKAAKGIGARSHVDEAREPLGARIRRAKMDKVPFVIVVGEEDEKAGTVGVNRRGSSAPERGVALAAFLEELSSEVKEPELVGFSYDD
jgi:threonyl-tRNA synthetase